YLCGRADVLDSRATRRYNGPAPVRSVRRAHHPLCAMIFGGRPLIRRVYDKIRKHSMFDAPRERGLPFRLTRRGVVLLALCAILASLVGLYAYQIRPQHHSPRWTAWTHCFGLGNIVGTCPSDGPIAPVAMASATEGWASMGTHLLHLS